MNIVNEIFLDIYTFAVSQIGLLALGWIVRGWLGTTAKQEINKLVTGDSEAE